MDLANAHDRNLQYARSDHWQATRDLDLTGAHDLNNSYAYTGLWLAMARMRAGKPYARKLDDQSKALPQDWPMPVISFYTVHILGAEMLAAARNPDKTKEREQLCEAHFHLGEWQLAHGFQSSALIHLRRARAGCPRNFIEYEGALEELKHLQAAVRLPATPAAKTGK